MNTPFDELAGFKNVNNKNDELKVSDNKKGDLSKKQLAFNRLTKRIQKLESSIETESVKMDRLVSFYDEEVLPNKIKLAEVQLDLAFALDESTNKHRLSKSITAKVKEAIVYMCEEAFEFILVKPESEALYDRWSDISFQEGLEQQKRDSKKMFSDFFGSTFSDKMNMHDLDLDDPESMARFQENIEQLFDEKKSASKSKRKSKKQLEKEEFKKQEEAIQNKSIRSIYISLTKILHPDTEIDEVLKKEKEELMKAVTAAYEQKDLSTLLRLEMEWVYKTSEHLEKLAEDKLKIYISVLKERVSELELEKHMLYRNPRLENVFPFIKQDENQAKILINHENDQIINEYLDLEGDISIFNRLKSKSDIIEFIEEFHEYHCEGSDNFGFNNMCY